MEGFQAEQELVDDYYCNHLKDDRSFMHLVDCHKFCCWFYYNGKDIDTVKKLRIFNSLHNQYKLKMLSWTKFSFQMLPQKTMNVMKNL